MALRKDRITLCWPNYIDSAALSGGQYVETLPLSRAQDRRFSRFAKTVDVDPESTWFTANLPRPSPVSVVAIPAHNMSSTATCRVRVYQDAQQDLLMWDSGERQVWPAVYSGAELEWEYDNYWFGTLSEEERNQYTPLMTVFLDAVQIAQSVRVDLSDPFNPQGFITFGRIFIADAWQPEFNMAWNPEFGFNSGTTLIEADDDARTEYADRKTPKRTFAFTLEHMSEGEAFGKAMRMQRTQDIFGEILFAASLAATPQFFDKTFIGRLESLDPLQYPYLNAYSKAFAAREIL